MRSTLLICLTLLPAAAIGCEAETFSPETHLADLRFVAVGYVTGERHPAFERQLLAGGPASSAPEFSERVVRVVPAERVAGRFDRTLEVRVPCDAPRPMVRERVIMGMLGDGKRWAFPAEGIEADVRAAFESMEKSAAESSAQASGE